MMIFKPGDKVTYLGHVATVMHGFDPADPFLPADYDVSRVTINIRLDMPWREHSRQFDAYISSVTKIEWASNKDAAAFDRWLTTDPENQPDNDSEESCSHEFVSWHGSRGECQECGEIIAPPISHQ